MEDQQQQQQDTRTHVVGELYDTERSYVESLQTLVEKYMKPLKGYDSQKTLIDSNLVDEIFYTIPEILKHHEDFLSALQDRLSSDWDSSQVIGNVFIEVIIDTYTAFINNWKNARQAIKVASHAKPAFERFLEAMSREHRNKLTLDALLIMPVQRIPRYELLIKELIKHTPEGHPDHGPLIEAQKHIHELALKIDRAEKEMLQQEQLRDIESLIDGHIDLQHPQRDFLRYDLVTISASTTLTVAKKERVLFLFCDLLIMTSIKKKVSRRANLQAAFTNSFNDISLLEGNKFKLILRVSLDQVDIKHNQTGPQSQINPNQLNNQQQNLLAQKQRQHIQLLNRKKREFENDLQLLKQIEMLSTKLNRVERDDLSLAVNRMSNQVYQGLANLDYEQQQANIDDIINHQDIYLTQQSASSIDPSNRQNSLQNLNNLDQERSAQAQANSINYSDQNTSLEFTIISGLNQSTNTVRENNNGMNTNLSSSSMASDYSSEQIIMNSGSGQDFDFNNNNAHGSVNVDTLVVNFTSFERRQAFLQAFNEAKLNRIQRLQRNNQHQQRMFSSSLTPRLSQDQSPIKSLPLAESDYLSEMRRNRLQHQDEVDLRLESSLANLRNNNANTNVSIASATRISSAPQYTNNNNTIVHQMSAPHALASIETHQPKSARCRHELNEDLIMHHCDTCSSSCLLNSSDNNDQKQIVTTNHDCHHHHQLMHQPSSQPAMLNMICCHDHHGRSQSGPYDSNRSDINFGRYHSTEINDYADSLAQKSIVQLESENGSSISRSSLRKSSSLPLKFVPKFMLTIPMNSFLTTQHPAMQFACSASHKHMVNSLNWQDTSRSAMIANTSINKTQTVKDDMGQFWLCMSNGYVSYVALISFKKRKVLTGSHGERHIYTSDSNQQPSFGLDFNQTPEFQCYDVIPIVQSGGDLCKSQINCAAHVGWSEAGRKDRPDISDASTKTGPMISGHDKIDVAKNSDKAYNNELSEDREPLVKVAIKSASPPIDVRRCDNNTNPKRACKTRISGSAPSSGLTDDEMIRKNLSKLSVTAASSTQQNTNGKFLSEIENRLSKDFEEHESSNVQVPGSLCEILGDNRPTMSKGAHRSSLNRRSFQHHHSHDHLRHHHHHNKQPNHQRSLSPSCSCNHNHIHGHAILAERGTSNNNAIHHQSRHIHRNQRYSSHHSHRHYHHHHTHNQNDHQQHNHHHHHHHHNQTNNVYNVRHNTVPLAELRRALERQNRILASDAEVNSGVSNAVSSYSNRRAYLNQLVPPSNTPCNLEKSSVDSSDSSGRRGDSPVGSLELAGSDERNSMKKARSTTPPTRHNNAKSFRSARMLRHQASLKTSSILAKLVSGAARSSSYLRRRESQSKRNSRPHKHSDMDDNDTDTDTSARAQSPNLGQQTEDASSTDSANILAGAIAGLAVPMSTNLQNNLRSNISQHNASDANVNNTSVVSPLSSVSSLTSTNSSLTFNSVCASSKGHGSCNMLDHQSNQIRPFWCSTTCCASDNTGRDTFLEAHINRIIDHQKLSFEQAENDPNEGQYCVRARSATVPCRAFCYLDTASEQPDSYLITKCSDNQEVENGLRRLKDGMLADRLISKALDESYKVSEIVDDPSGNKRPREVYHRVDGKDSINRSSKDNFELENKDKSSLWLGCDDGSLIVIDCLEQKQPGLDSSNKRESQRSCRNIHSEIKLDSAICDIKNYNDRMIFVALANGKLAVFKRDHKNEEPIDDDFDGATSSNSWLLKDPKIVSICQNEDNATCKLCLVHSHEQLWYSYGRSIYVIGIKDFLLKETIITPTDDRSVQFSMRSIHIDHMELTSCLDGVWVSFKGNPLIQFYDCRTLKLVVEMSLLEPINKVLSYGNEIIRQHKTACLGATSLLSVSSDKCSSDGSTGSSTSLFIGTTAGIIIYLNICHQLLKEHIEAEKSVWIPQVISLRHGHSGQVRFLRLVDMDSELNTEDDSGDITVKKTDGSPHQLSKQLCLVSAGAGLDLYGPNNERQVIQQLSGDEDCLNHMIFWQL